jgi:hypothetical protein
VYAPKEIKEDLSNMLLLDAFKFYTEENPRYMIISAHSAIEILLNKFIKKFLKEKGASETKSEKFLDATDNFHKLGLLIPVICEIKRFPIINKNIMENLKSLNTSRNNLMHYGKTDMNTEKIKRELISAFLAFKYFKLIHEI